MKKKKKWKRVLKCPDHSNYGFYVCPEGHIHAIPNADMHIVTDLYEMKEVKMIQPKG